MYKKKVIILVITFIFIISEISIFSTDSKSAVDYLNMVSKKYEKISIDLWDYIKTAAHNKFVFMAEGKRKKLLKTIQTSINDISKTPDFNGDNKYKEAVLNYLNTEYSLLNEDYSKIVDMEEVAEQSYDLMEMYLLAKELANAKFEEASKILNTKTEEFAKSNNITLIEKESKINKNLEISDEIADYYNKIFLIFFKNNKQEAYFVDSSNKGDINAMQQNLSVFGKYIDEGLGKVKNIPPYNDDNSLIENITIIFNFYKNESTEKFPIYTDFYIKKEMFEKFKKNFDLISKSERTQTDIDQYNLQVKEYNNMINNFNKVNNDLNKERQKLIEVWNTAVKKFMDKHIPK